MSAGKSTGFKSRLPVSPVRILIYLCFYLLNILLYRFFYSYLHLTLWVLMSVLPFLSGISLRLLMNSLEIKLGGGETVHIGESGTAVIQIKNPSFGMTLRGNILITVSNSFYGSRGEVELSTAISAKKKKTIEFPVGFDLCGNAEVKIEKIVLWDLLGLVSRKKEMDVQSDFLVLPRREKEQGEERVCPQISDGITENESSSKKGQDYSEISGVREYAAGDRMKDIHWKLSAKKGEMLVKERVSMSDEQLVVIPELSGSAQETEQVLKALYDTLAVVSAETEVNLCWWDARQKDFVSYRVREEREIAQAFSYLYHSGKYEEILAKTYVRQMLKEVKVYLYICGDSGEVNMEIVANE